MPDEKPEKYQYWGYVPAKTGKMAKRWQKITEKIPENHLIPIAYHSDQQRLSPT